MARHEVFRSAATGPYLLDCQSDVFSYFSTRLVAPLLRVAEVPRPTRRLHPVFVVEGVDFVMATHLVSAVPVRTLGAFIVSLDEHHAQIRDALDMLMCGY